MTRELHVYDHASAMIALLFVSPNGTVEAFDVEGFNRIGEFARRTPLRLRALMWRCRAWIPDFAQSSSVSPPVCRVLALEPVRRTARSGGGALPAKTKPRRLLGLSVQRTR
jgi:hypothetical protein